MGSPNPIMTQQAALLVAASAAVAVVALIVALSAHRRLALTRRSLGVLQATASGKTMLEAVAGYGRDLKAFENGLNKIMDRQEELMASVRQSVRNVAVVRYDAFEDMGGRLSFSAAMVDDHGNGLVLSAISGRSEARAYAKIVDEGESEMGLSPEEREAIAEALSGRKRQKVKVKARR
jgi:hypothetical protein